MAYIELVNNPIEIFEENEMNNQKETLGLQSYWAWEHKLLQQEQTYFQNLIQNLDAQVQRELDETLTKQVGGDAAETVDAFNNQLKTEIEAKFTKKRNFLETNLKRAQFEETIHLKQEKYNRYERLFQQYAFPAGEFKVAYKPENQRINA